jgi:hypothetical protein
LLRLILIVNHWAGDGTSLRGWCITVGRLVLCLALPAGVRAAPDSRLDVRLPDGFRLTNPNLLDECEQGAVIAQIARAGHTSIGFESPHLCWLRLGPFAPDLGKPSEVLHHASVRDALNRFVQLAPQYSWHAIGGVAVVRPTAAWDDPSNPLNVAIAPFRTTGEPLHAVLHRVLQAAVRPIAWEHQDYDLPGRPDRPLTVTFDGGTLVNALTVVAAAADAEWQVGYQTNGELVRGTIIVTAQDENDGTTMIPFGLAMQDSLRGGSWTGH